MSLQPAPTGVLVEIVTGLHRLIHVLQEPSGFKVSQRREGMGEERQGDGVARIHMWLENSFSQGWGLTLFAK